MAPQPLNSVACDAETEKKIASVLVVSTDGESPLVPRKSQPCAETHGPRVEGAVGFEAIRQSETCM